MNFKLVAVDEASRFKEAGSQRSVALYGGRVDKKLSSPGLIYNSKHTVFLDGSPMPNRPIELWAPTYSMSPESINFRSFRDFGFRYGGAKMNEWGGWEFRHSSNEDELRKKLQKTFMHVVPESALKHPERRRSIIFMNSDPRNASMKAWEQKNIDKLNLGQLDEEISRGEIASYRRELGISKVPWILRHVKERLEKGNQRILLFCWHREVADALHQGLGHHSFGCVIGGTSEKLRNSAFEKLQMAEANGVIIGNISSLGRGHNGLQSANRVLFAEFSWTDENNTQCEKRASRTGSTNLFVPCGYIVAPNTLDEITLNAVFTKQSRTKRIIG